MVKKTAYVWGRFIAVASIILFFPSCGHRSRREIPEIQVKYQSPTITITSWRIVGPFQLPAGEQVYTLANEEKVLNQDFLAGIGGSESPFKIGSSTTNGKVDFDRDMWSPPPKGFVKDPSKHPFYNQVIDFPTPQIDSYVLFGFHSEFFKVMYAISSLMAAADTETSLVVSANSPVKVWLNGSVVAMPPPGSVGNTREIQHVVAVHLKKGNNYLVAKMYCFPLRNEFSVRVAGRAGALAFIKEKGGIRDLLDQIVVRPGMPLRLSKNLYFYGTPSKNDGIAQILDPDDKVVSQLQVDFSGSLEISSKGLQPGLYTMRVQTSDSVFSEQFYIGLPETIFPTYQARCKRAFIAEDPVLDPCPSLAGLQEIHDNDLSKNFRLDWQKRAVVYASMAESGLRKKSYGLKMHTYRSQIDGQLQYYFFYAPKTIGKDHPKPLVIEIPHNAYQAVIPDDKPDTLGAKKSEQDIDYQCKLQFLKNRDANYLTKLGLLCDEYDYACLWPFARFRQFDAPLAIADTLECLDDAERIYKIDQDRIYPRGFCKGGNNAIMFAESYPDRFAAVSSINLTLGILSGSNQEWQTINDIGSRVGNMLYTPLQMFHGTFYPHSPTWQSNQFLALCNKNEIPASLELQPGDTQWADRDEHRLSFDYFRNKKRIQKPSMVSFSTGQLKYSSADWVRINSLSKPAHIGSIQAQLDKSNRVILSTENVGEVELLREKMPDAFAAIKHWDVIINGIKSNYDIGKNGRMVLQIEPIAPQEGLYKNRNIEGPISHAFAQPFLLVQGSRGDIAAQKSIEQVVESIEKSWKKNYFVGCRRKKDRDVTAEDIRNLNLILVGDRNSNVILDRIGDSLPLSINPKEVTIGDRTYPGKALITAVYPNPLNTNRYVVIITSNDIASLSLPEPDLALHANYDVAIWQSIPGRGFGIVSEFWWDNSWSRLLLAATAPEAVRDK
jgi:hypothetical protein